VTRAQFINTLRRGLRDLPANVVDDIVADYESFFEEGFRAGRSQEDLVNALGTPGRLAAELRLAVAGNLWQSARSARSILRVLATGFGLLVADALLLFPMSILLLVCAAALLVVALALFYGLCLVVIVLFSLSDNALASLLTALGFISGAISGGAALLLASGPILRLLARYGRLQSRLLLVPTNLRSSTTDVKS